MEPNTTELKKLNFRQMKQALTPEEMKKIMAGIPDCQVHAAHCDTESALNCCSGLYCEGNVCVVKDA
ncbi:hypothetical protein HGH92_27350 [Chitinophaga varians]|uniref:Uncharacterized protein n=1 Tax=Chitinophaga varians TaxID=2202339 RepID=A0A847RYB3_9BACT|nr:hypothetical protein [Chitinophaga varians]NLR68052.1 hypothetical protein [Chitinophaga varians]